MDLRPTPEFAARPFIDLDAEGEDSIGRVYLMKHSERAGRWHWSRLIRHV